MHLPLFISVAGARLALAAARLNLLSTLNQILTTRRRKKTPTPPFQGTGVFFW